MAPESHEVRQRINSLYDRAEDATGNFNATRALSGARRSRGVPLAKRSGGRQDPALEAVARQWFEGARAKLGPSVPAVLPADRQPGRAAGPGRSQEPAGGARDALSVGLPELAPGSAGRPGERAVAELPSGSSTGTGGRPRLALEAGGAGLPAGRPALPSGRTVQSATGTGELPALGPGWGTAGQRAGDAPEPTGPVAAGALGFGSPDGTGQGRIMAPGQATAEPLAFGSLDTTGQGRVMTPGQSTAEPLAFGTPDTTGQGRIMAPGQATAEPLAFGTPDTTGQGRVMASGQNTAAQPSRGTAGYLSGGTADTNGGGMPMPAPELPRPAGVSPGLALPDAALQATATLPVQDAGRPTRGTAGYLNGSTTDTGPQAALFAGQGSVMLPTQRQAPVGDTGMTDVLGQGFPGASGHGPAETAVLPAVAPQAPPARQPRDLPTSTGAPRRTPPSQSKAANQRKIAAAGDLLFRRAAQLTTAATAVQAAPAPQSGWATGVQQVPQPLPEARAATEQWQQPGQPGLQQPAPIGFQAQSQLDAGQWQQPSGAIPGMAAAPGLTAPTGPAASLATTPPTPEVGSPAHPLPALTDTASYSPVPAPSFPQVAATTAPLPLPAPHTTRAAKAIAFARAQVGKPCVWGATGPDSYDCSSLTQAAWRAAGVALPRAAHEQAVAGTPVTLAGLEPGDLVLFFDDDRHVGLHIGGGMMVHAPGPGSSIREESIYGAGESAIHRVIRPA